MFGRIVPVIARQTARRGIRSYHEERLYPKASYNDLPVPQGSWKASYERDQKQYNATLLAGVTILTATIAFGRMSGCLDFNFLPPKPE